MTPHIVFIGGGNIARSLIAGLVRQGMAPQQCSVCDRHTDKMAALQAEFGIATSADANRAVATATTVILAVKPAACAAALEALRPTLATARPLLISVAAGITTPWIATQLGSEDYPLVRAMPNTPAQVGVGMTGLFASAAVTSVQRNHVSELFAAVGEVVWVTEEMMIDHITALSGSGPAYFFQIMAALAALAQTWGFDASTARHLVTTTAQGAVAMAQTSDQSLTTLREQVTSPGGTTAAALERWQAGGVDDHIKAAATAALHRARELAS